MSLGALARGGMERERRRDSPMPRARRRRRPLGDVRRITAQNRRDPRPPRHVGLAGSHSQSGRIWAISLGAAVRAPASFFGDREPRRRRDSAPTEFPRHGRGRDSSPRNLRVAAAASPRPVSAESPRRSRGVAATRLHGISASQPRRRRDPSAQNLRAWCPQVQVGGSARARGQGSGAAAGRRGAAAGLPLPRAAAQASEAAPAPAERALPDRCPLLLGSRWPFETSEARREHAGDRFFRRRRDDPAMRRVKGSEPAGGVFDLAARAGPGFSFRELGLVAA